MKHFLQHISDLVLISKPCARSAPTSPSTFPSRTLGTNGPYILRGELSYKVPLDWILVNLGRKRVGWLTTLRKLQSDFPPLIIYKKRSRLYEP